MRGHYITGAWHRTSLQEPNTICWGDYAPTGSQGSLFTWKETVTLSKALKTRVNYKYLLCAFHYPKNYKNVGRKWNRKVRFGSVRSEFKTTSGGVPVWPFTPVGLKIVVIFWQRGTLPYFSSVDFTYKANSVNEWKMVFQLVSDWSVWHSEKHTLTEREVTTGNYLARSRAAFGPYVLAVDTASIKVYRKSRWVCFIYN